MSSASACGSLWLIRSRIHSCTRCLISRKAEAVIAFSSVASPPPSPEPMSRARSTPSSVWTWRDSSTVFTHSPCSVSSTHMERYMPGSVASHWGSSSDAPPSCTCLGFGFG